MALSLLDAAKLVECGDAEPYLASFIGSVKFAAVTGTSAAIALDDALIVSIALAGLLDTSEGRKLLKLPKRKNTKYKASDYRLTSPQRRVVIEFMDGRFDRSAALEKFFNTFDGQPGKPPDDRTLRRLFDDLVDDQDNFNLRCGDMLRTAGATGQDRDSKKAAADLIMKNLGVPRRHAK